MTGDAEVRTVKNDKNVINFTVALNKRWKSKDGEVHEKVAFLVCAYWANAAVAEFLTKGGIVEVSGWMEVRAWATGDGESKASLTCSVESLRLFGNPASKSKGGSAKAKGKTISTKAMAWV